MNDVQFQDYLKISGHSASTRLCQIAIPCNGAFERTNARLCLDLDKQA
jgi:hypothetical protein